MTTRSNVWSDELVERAARAVSDVLYDEWSDPVTDTDRTIARAVIAVIDPYVYDGWRMAIVEAERDRLATLLSDRGSK